ncbi:hypothetical protein AB0K80_10605 [Streptomyces sp. NPDC052682]|uniref:hypothetical protein n=1 Tax=Streptomyces sp. NPDC052682 TaxID=3154954 RepID=UPI003417548D
MPRRGRFRRGAAALTLVALGGGGLLAAAPAATGAAGAAPAPDGTACTPAKGFEGCRLFDPASGAQHFEVPSGVTKLDVRAWGEGGTGTRTASGGAGGFVAGTLGVTAGEKLTVTVGGPDFGDARGGKGGTGTAARGGNSSGVRTGTGTPLVIAGGGGGAGGDRAGHGQGGAAGGTDGQDGSEPDRGGKGATGAKGGAGTGNGAAGADHTAGGAGGDGGTGRDGGGGGGAGYAGGGGGAGSAPATTGKGTTGSGGTGSAVDTGKGPTGSAGAVSGPGADQGTTGGGGGGSSYADPDRVTGARLVAGTGAKPPEKTDPFWAPGDQARSGVAAGGAGAPGGPGRIVLQWDTPAVAELTQVSGAGQVAPSYDELVPFGIQARDKDGKPVAHASVTYTIDDPDALGVHFGDRAQRTAVVTTDAQGRAVSPRVAGAKDGTFTVRASVGDASTTFTAEVGEALYDVTIVEGDGQVVAPGQSFPDRLTVQVTHPDVPAVGTPVTFELLDLNGGGPRFEGGEKTVRVETDAEGTATAPELIAGEAEGEYVVYASAGDDWELLFLTVTSEPDGGSPGPKPTSSVEPIPSPSTGTAGGTAGGGTGGGTSTQLGGGSLASTGAAGTGPLTTGAAALTVAGLAAVLVARRMKSRTETGD